MKEIPPWSVHARGGERSWDFFCWPVDPVADSSLAIFFLAARRVQHLLQLFSDLCLTSLLLLPHRPWRPPCSPFFFLFPFLIRLSVLLGEICPVVCGRGLALFVRFKLGTCWVMPKVLDLQFFGLIDLPPIHVQLRICCHFSIDFCISYLSPAARIFTPICPRLQVQPEQTAAEIGDEFSYC